MVTMNFKLTASAALLAASFLAPAQAQSIELRPIFRYAFEPSDLTRFDTSGNVYAIFFEVESTYTGPTSQAGLRIEIYDDKNFTGPGYSFDAFATGSTVSFDIPYELFDQVPLGWADGVGSLEVYAWSGPITLNRLSFRVTAPTAGYFKDLQLSAVPEPSSLAFLMAGLPLAGLMLRRRQDR